MDTSVNNRCVGRDSMTDHLIDVMLDHLFYQQCRAIRQNLCTNKLSINAVH